jgi:hypothetical protein
MLRTEVYDKEEKKKAIIISISEYNNNHLGSLDFCRKNGQEMHKLSKWAGSDSNQRPPPCQGGILTRLDHRPYVYDLKLFTMT